MLVFNLIASAWLPQLDYSSAAKKKKGKGGNSGGGAGQALLAPGERLYLWGLVAVELATGWAMPLLLGDRLPFLPLMTVSLYCSLGMLHAWRRLAVQCW